MLHAGLDLSRKRLDVCVLAEDGTRLATTLCPPDADGLRHLVKEVRELGGPVQAVIESMNGARFVHDTLELHGWDVEIADAQKAKGLAPLTCKTDKIDAWVLAELSRRDLVPSIWLPTPGVRAERERARFRLHLVRHRVMLKNRVHTTPLAFGKPCSMSDLFGLEGRELLARLDIPDPLAHGHGDHPLAHRHPRRRDSRHRARAPRVRRDPPLRPAADDRTWDRLGARLHDRRGDRRHPPLLEPEKLVGYTGLTPFVIQSGSSDRRGSLAKNGPKYLRWALIEATTHAAKHPAYKEHFDRTAERLGRQRGKKIARVEIARKLAEAIWHMCQTGTAFAPARSRDVSGRVTAPS